jgi:DNA polymerase-3 subunit delta'
MTTMNVLLADQTRTHLEAITRVRSGSFIFHGPHAAGKATAAAELARHLNCRGDETGPCAPCRQFQAGNYPDYLVVRPEDKPSILIEQIRGLIQTLALSPYYAGGIRVVVIDGADLMTVEAQNALLKLIEEPPAQTIFILVAERLGALLPTVRSRCAHIHFPRQPHALIARLLVERHGVASAQAGELAAAAGGAPGEAVLLAARPEVAAARLELVRAAAAVPQQPAFDRLLLAARLATAGADLPRFAALLHVGLADGLRRGAADPTAARRGLDALEQFRRRLQAKVAPRVALECLMLEL